MKAFGRTKVAATLEASSARSDSMWYLATAFSSRPVGAALEESSTARATPARSSSATIPASS